MANEDWMRSYTSSTTLRLRDLTLPASHDAGLPEGGIEKYNPGFIGRKIASKRHIICQHYNIEGQLQAGSRFFDLRISTHNNVLTTFHGEGLFGSIGGGWGQDVESIFNQVADFLRAHTGEIVILRISHTSEANNAKALADRLIPRDLRYCGLGKNLARVPLNELKGKAILIYDPAAMSTPVPGEGFHRFGKYTSKTDRSEANLEGLFICGKYAGQGADMTAVAKMAINKANEHGPHHHHGNPDAHLFMVYWQRAMDVQRKTVLTDDTPYPEDLNAIDPRKPVHYNLAYILNGHLAKPVAPIGGVSYTDELRVGKRHRFKPNLINLDFVDDNICSKIIAFNAALLGGGDEVHETT